MSEEDWPDINADDPQERLRYFWRLRASFGRECATIDDDQLNRLIQVKVPLSNLLDIKEPNEVVRFLALFFMITEEQRASNFLMQVYRQVITNTDVSARRRLNFVFRHLVGRPPPLHEPDFGGWFTTSREMQALDL